VKSKKGNSKQQTANRKQKTLSKPVGNHRPLTTGHWLLATDYYLLNRRT